MIKYCLKCWNENQQRLCDHLTQDTKLNSCSYEYLVRLVVEKILGEEWDGEHITTIDNGDYQGTLLFLIPEVTYQPSESDYLMTYVGYGSCSGCDALQAIQDSCAELLTPKQVTAFMALCKDLITNMIKPYNIGWRESADFEPVSMD